MSMTEHIDQGVNDGIIPDDRYSFDPLPYWICPHCKEQGGVEIWDHYPPACGVIAVECNWCDYSEL
jgi:hypothetical protein